ncbi:bromodomain-containing protein DDB_G0280777 [Drosophila grimshawi]|uniref:bromodomain-containing protein DDB_G0280777 n=1 Tax=Drosophila grimshawi TaxID=7222 RepID=UPI000C870F2F|nr:bromodomain-containing protein DDB_G0280777 [Drosophila grimshawi]
MDNKTLAEGNARRRRNNTTTAQQREQQRQLELQREREWVGNTQATGKAATLPKSQLHLSAKALPNGKGNKSNNNNAKKRNRCLGAVREPVQRPVLRTSSVAFGCSYSVMSFMSTLSAIPTQPTKCNKFKSPQQLKSMKPMEAAHKQLELLLTRIENDAVKPRQMAVPVTEPASKRQRCKPPAPAKRVRQQMEHPPPVPTVSPLNSARRNETTTTTTMLSVPLTHNPQLLLETISQSDKQEKQQVVNILHSEHNTNHDHYHHDDDGDDDDVNDADDGDPSKDAVHPTLQMLPLALTPGESPYRENFLPGHRVPRERQKKQQQQLQAPKTQLDTSGKIFQSVLPVEDFDDEKPVSDTKLEHHDQPAEIQPESQQMRQLQAMKERAELDRQKQLVIEWRLRHRLTELRQTEQQMTKRVLKKSLQLKQLKKTISERNARRRVKLLYSTQATVNNSGIDEDWSFDQDLDDDDDDVTPRPNIVVSSSTPDDDDDLSDALKQRQQFQEQCQQSCLYSDPKCSTPWNMIANISNTFSTQLMEIINAELHQSIPILSTDLANQSN